MPQHEQAEPAPDDGEFPFDADAHIDPTTVLTSAHREPYASPATARRAFRSVMQFPADPQDLVSFQANAPIATSPHALTFTTSPVLFSNAILLLFRSAGAPRARQPNDFVEVEVDVRAYRLTLALAKGSVFLETTVSFREEIVELTNGTRLSFCVNLLQLEKLARSLRNSQDDVAWLWQPKKRRLALRWHNRQSPARLTLETRPCSDWRRAFETTWGRPSNGQPVDARLLRLAVQFCQPLFEKDGFRSRQAHLTLEDGVARAYGDGFARITNFASPALAAIQMAVWHEHMDLLSSYLGRSEAGLFLFETPKLHVLYDGLTCVTFAKGGAYAKQNMTVLNADCHSYVRFDRAALLEQLLRLRAVSGDEARELVVVVKIEGWDRTQIFLRAESPDGRSRGVGVIDCYRFAGEGVSGRAPHRYMRSVGLQRLYDATCFGMQRDVAWDLLNEGHIRIREEERDGAFGFRSIGYIATTWVGTSSPTRPEPTVVPPGAWPWMGRSAS